MPNNIAVAVTADVADLTAKMAIARAEVQATSKVLNDLAKNSGGDQTVEVRTAMLAAGDAAAKARSEYALLGREMRAVTSEIKPAADAQKAFMESLKDQVATQGMSRKELAAYRAQQLGVAQDAAPLIEALKGSEHGMVSSRAATEGLVLVHEAMQGRYSKMTGSAMILTQALAGQENVTAAVNFVTSAAGAAIIGTAIAMGTAIYSAVRYEAVQRELLNTSLGLGAAAGLTSAQLHEAAAVASDYSGQSVHAVTASAEAFAAAGIRSQEVVAGLAGSVKGYAVLTGQEAADAQKALATAMQDPIKGAADLNAQLGILDATQMEQIRTMVDAGDKTGAANVIMQAMRQRIDDAQQAGVRFNSVWDRAGSTLSNLCDWLGRATAAMARFAAESVSSIGDNTAEIHLVGGKTAQDEAAEAAARHAREMARLKEVSAAGGEVARATPEMRDAERRASLQGSFKKLQDGLAADTALYGAHSEAVERDQRAMTDYKRAIDTFLPAAEKAHQIAQKDAEIAEARKGHDKQRIADLTRQRELLNMAGEVISPDNANRAANDAAGKAAASATPARKHDDVVAQWAEELHQQEIASGDFFRDQTANELKFWQGRLALTTAGSKDRLAVQARIYEAEKTLARQAYQDHLADLNERIQADRNNWGRQQADWGEKLAFIKSKYTEQSAEYKNAAREWTRIQQQHDEQEFKDSQQAAKRAVDELKKNLDTQAKTREEDAKAQQALIRNNAGNRPFGDVSAQAQIGQIEAQLIQQRIADLDTYHTAQDAQLRESVEAARIAYGEKVDAYKSAVQAQLDADQQYKAQHQQLEAQQQMQSIQSLLAVQQAYHGYIDGVVSSSVTGFDEVISGQRTWAQMGIGLYATVMRTFEQQLAHMVSNWIVQHLLMSAAQRAQLAAQTAAHTASEVAQTGATVAGTTARTAATVAGAATERTVTSATNKGAIMSQAATAAAGAYKAMSAIPVVGPILGAAAAASTFTAVTAYATLASFDKGVDVLPADMIAQVHAGERIIPAADNRAIMDAVGANGGRQGISLTSHFSPTINAPQGSTLKDMIRNEYDSFVSAIASAHRSGSLKFR